MLNELLSIFRTGDGPVIQMARNFKRMLELALENTLSAGEIYFGKKTVPEDRTRIYDQDVQINQLERKIRKQVVAHLTVKGNYMDVPYCLLLMSLVKDVERLGDYAKNISEVVDVHSGGLPDNEVVQELREIRLEVERSFKKAVEVFELSDRDEALSLIARGRDIAHRCDALIAKNASSDHDASTTTAIVLGTRFYKRVGGHVLNILSSVVMPLHKIDYYDEDEVPEQRSK